jgi:hypothetical protein
MIRYRPFFPNSLFYPCSAFDGYLIRLINSQPDKFKTANFVHVDIGDYSIINPGDIEKTSALFNKFKSKLDEIPYYNFESTPLGIKQITNKDLPLVSFYDSEIVSITESFQILNTELAELRKTEGPRSNDDWVISKADGLEILVLPDMAEKFELMINDRVITAIYRGTKKAIFKGKAGHDSIYVMFALGDAFDFYQTIYFEQNTMPLIFAEKYGKVDFRTEIIQGNLSSKWIISDKLSPGDEITGYQKEETNLHTRWDHSLEIFKRQ